MKKQFLFMVALFLVSSSLLAGGEGLALVRSIYDKMQVQPKGSEVYYFSYSVRSTLRKAPAGKDRVSESSAEVYLSASQARFISKQIEVYMDDENAFTVIPAKKTIYWGDSNRGRDRDKYVNSMGILQDSLLAMCSEKEYRAVDMAGADRLLVLEPKTGTTKALGISRLLFYIDTKTKSIKKVTIEYPPGNEMESVEMTFRRVDFNYQATALKGRIRSIFIHGKSSLTPAYAGYRLIDNRKKSS